MQAFLKYMGLFFLMVVAASLALLAVGVYQTFGKINAFFEGADTYTCGQFVTDLQTEGTSKVFPVALGVLAYGGSFEKGAFEHQVEREGAMPGVKKLFAACQGQPGEKLFDLFARDAMKPAVPGAGAPATVAGATVSATGAISPVVVPPATLKQTQ